MGVFDKLKGWAAPKPLFKAKVPDLKKYVGKKIRIPDVGKVIIKTIVGNIGKTINKGHPMPQYYEINGTHLISMLRFHAQMEGADDITEQQFKDFEAIQFECEKIPDAHAPGKKMKDVPNDTTESKH